MDLLIDLLAQTSCPPSNGPLRFFSCRGGLKHFYNHHLTENKVSRLQPSSPAPMPEGSIATFITFHLIALYGFCQLMRNRYPAELRLYFPLTFHCFSLGSLRGRSELDDFKTSSQKCHPPTGAKSV